MPTLKIFYHGRCFDGVASAAVFRRFFERYRTPHEVSYQAMTHSETDPFETARWDADVNACVDFRYTDNPSLAWWFDHHETAFQPRTLRNHFDADTSGTKFFDPHAASCAGFIAGVAQGHFGIATCELGPSMEELVRWADIVDRADFPSAAEAVSMEEPALQLAALVGRGVAFATIVDALGQVPIADLVRHPDLSAALRDTRAARLEGARSVEGALRMDGDVAIVDLGDSPGLTVNGFVVYAVAREATYSLLLTRSRERISISVGHNPWATSPRRHHLGELCETHRGGGHAYVAGVTLPPGELVRARRVLQELAESLRGASG